MSVVRRYLDAVASREWDVARACLSPGVQRVGPFGDAYAGRDEYLEFLRRLMPTLKGYEMRIDRVIVGDDGSCAVAELTETIELGGRTVCTPESLVFDLDADGRIVRIRIYIQQL